MAGDTTMIGVALFAPNVLTKRLERIVPSAIGIGLKDLMRTVKADVLARTPVGWVYIPSRTGKRGQKIKGRYVKSSSAAGKKAAGAGIAKSWRIDGNQLSFSIGTDMPYALVLEDGKYPNPPNGKIPSYTDKKGNRVPYPPWASGWRVKDGFSRQAPEGLLQPIYDDPKYLDGAIDLIAERIIQQFTG